MCNRSDMGCNAEYGRYVRTHYKDRRNETVRRYRARRVRERQLSVYAVWFPVPRVLKVGFTSHKINSPFVGVARTKAGRQGLDTEGSSCIWKQSGDERTEAWIQSTLAFRWYPALEQQHSRICEWFSVPGLTEAEVVAMLDAVYGLAPPDTRTPVQLPMF